MLLMTTFTLNLPDEVINDLRGLAAAEGVTMADLIRPEIERTVWAKKLQALGRAGAMGHMSNADVAAWDNANAKVPE
jgi:hypothetical protein